MSVSHSEPGGSEYLRRGQSMLTFSAEPQDAGERPTAGGPRVANPEKDGGWRATRSRPGRTEQSAGLTRGPGRTIPGQSLVLARGGTLCGDELWPAPPA